MESKAYHEEYVESATYAQKTCIHHHTSNSLKSAWENNNINIVHKLRKPRSNQFGKVFTDLILIIFALIYF